MAPRVFYLLHQAHSALFRAADARLREQFGLTVAQQAVLLVLMRDNGAPLSQIAKTLGMGKPGLSALVDRMCASGLVRRECDTTDGRVTRIVLMPEGQRLAQASLFATRAANRRLLEPFAPQEQAVIERFLIYAAQHSGAIVAGTGRKAKTQ